MGFGNVILNLITAAGVLTSHHVGNVPVGKQSKYEAIELVTGKISGVAELKDKCTGLTYDQTEDGTHVITCDLSVVKNGGKRGLKSRKSKKTKKRKTKSLKKKRKQTKKRKTRRN